MRVRTTYHNEVEDLELELFEEFKGLQKKAIPKETSVIVGILNSLFVSYRNFNAIIVIKLTDDGRVICSSGNQFNVLHENPMKVKTGDVLLTYNYEIFLIEKGIDKTYLDDCRKRLVIKNFVDKKTYDEDETLHKENLRISIDSMKLYDMLTKKHIEEAIKDEIADCWKDIKRRKADAVKTELAKSPSLKAFEEKCKGQFGNFYVDGQLISSGSEKLVLRKKVNELFNLGQLTDTELTIRRMLDQLLIDRRGFTYFKDNKQIVSVNHEYVGDKLRIRVNDKRIKSRRTKTIVEKILSGASEEELDVMNKLSGIKMDVVGLDHIKFQRSGTWLRIPINFIAISKMEFRVIFLDKEQNITWDQIKTMFLFDHYGRELHDVDIRNTVRLMTICEFMKVSKQELFDYMKQLVMLQSLAKENKDDNYY